MMGDRGPQLSRRGLLMATASAGTLGTLAAAAPRRWTSDAGAESRRPGRLREYWIQADAFEHNAVPTGRDGAMGDAYRSDQTTYWAVGFRAYTPGWRTPLKRSSDLGANSGIPGPVLRARVGDRIRVHFRNADMHYGFAHSIHAHGVAYSPDSDGAWYAARSDKRGTAIAPGASYTYEWQVPASALGTWVYHDHSVPNAVAPSTTPVMEIGAQLGLFGIIAITDADTPSVDREIILFFHDLFQSDIPALAQDLDCFNGRAFVGNTPDFHARVGDRVRWRVASLGQEMHIFHVHGHRWRSATGAFTDTEILGPATTATVEWAEQQPGEWLYHCHIVEHMMGGMVGRYRVRDRHV
jgi:FtsP/CotA-like multicopper oxidase with cupredoxin domain